MCCDAASALQLTIFNHHHQLLTALQHRTHIMVRAGNHHHTGAANGYSATRELTATTTGKANRSAPPASYLGGCQPTTITQARV